MTNRKLLAILAATFCLLLGYTSGYSDTLVDVNSLTFHSDFEKQVYHDFFEENKEDYFALYMSMDSTIDKSACDVSRRTFEVLISEFKEPSYQKMKKSKLVRKIYNSVHSRLLDKYTMKTNFSAAFSKGEYQCVTGSMLFALVFDELNIPYEIKLLPDHAYLIAYPETDYILVETTNPMKGTMVFNAQFKSNYVDYLRDNKLISKEEYATMSKDDLFDKYYNKPEIINKKQLAGAQYRNMAFAKLGQMDVLDAYHLMEKAYFFHPNQNNSYLLLIMLASALDKTSYKSEEYADLLGKLMHFHGKSLTTDQLFDMFAGMTYRQLEYDGNIELYKKSYQTIINQVKDSALRSEISFLYNYDIGRVLFNKKQYEEAIPYVEKSYAIKPKNGDAEDLFFNLLSINIDKSLYNKNDKEELLNDLNKYKERNPLLENNYTYRSYWLKLCLMLMDDNYYAKNVQKGEKYRLLFEEKYPESEYELRELNDRIVHAYATAAAYYFQKGNYKQSREMINKGLHYSPNNKVLLKRLRWL
jgi:tetratricopeptide (TPR) repeat protein